MRWLQSTLGRAAAGASALVTLAWFLWPEPQWHIHPDALAALVIAVVVWIGSLTPAEAKKVTIHDVALLKRFRALISEGEKDFLREHDFGGTFSWERLAGTREFADTWRGAEYEFDDQDVQKALAALAADASEFVHQLALGSVVIGANQRASSIPDIERSGEISARTWAEIKAHNERATKLMDDINVFIKFARQRIDG